MENQEIYESMNSKEGIKVPSYMGIIPRDPNYIFTEQSLRKAIEDNPQFKLIELLKIEDEEEDSADIDGEKEEYPDMFQLEIEYESETYSGLVCLMPNDLERFQSFSFANSIDEESLDDAAKSEYYVDLSIRFQDDPMVSFLVQLKLLHTIVPNACLIVDLSSLRLLSPHWLEMTAASNIPPSPKYLYTIHGVYDEKGEETYYWMHTHGLHRCGSMELELVNIKSGPNEMSNLLSTTADMFIMDHHLENEKFKVGYDGLGLHLCWLRWEEALQKFPEDILGGLKDRSEEDGHNVHSEPSGILFAVEEDNEYVSPEIYASTLADNPIFFIRTDETLRMSALAKERFDLFEKIFKTNFKPKEEKKSSFLGKIFKKKEEEEEQPEWSFLVKLGLVTDDAESENDREHLWFQVNAVEGNNVTGTLINQPYWIAKLNEGDVMTYPISEVLTDWIIYGPDGEYTPDSIYLLA